MKTRNVLGKRIVAVKQYRPGNRANVAGLVCLEYIELDNGTRLVPLTIEGESEYHTELILSRKGKATR